MTIIATLRTQLIALQRSAPEHTRMRTVEDCRRCDSRRECRRVSLELASIESVELSR
jgi:hypothetical protein